MAIALYADGTGAKLSLSVVFGALFGFTLQRSRFCFFCIFNDWVEHRDPRGLFGLLLALAVGICGYTLIYGAWLPDSGAGRLPPDAFIGPMSVMLVYAGLAFGTGMAISGSCISAHLYRLGEGSPTAPFALIGTAAGMALGYTTWSTTYSAIVAPAPVIWLPAIAGYTGAMFLAVGALALLALALRYWSGGSLTAPRSAPKDIATMIFVDRWPTWLGGLVIGILGTAAYLRVAPLGVTAEISARARQTATFLGYVPSRIEGLDTLRGCIAVATDAVLTPNGLFVIALVFAAFASALAAGQFRPTIPQLSHIAKGIAGGIFMGWGAVMALGCTVGTLLSGIMAGAASGWIFAVAVFLSAIAVPHFPEAMARGEMW